MIKFEKHDGLIFKMLDEPTPLTPDAEVPCLTRLIQDDSRMGMFNRDTKPSRLSDFYLVARIVSNNIVVDEFMESDYNRFEIIGTPVKEGSDEWALYQMMQGNKVRHKSYSMPKVHCAMNEKCQIAIFTTPSSMIDGGDVICHANDWLTSRQVDTMIDERTGWQIYKEPEPQYKVGDWVEWSEGLGISYQSQITRVSQSAVYSKGICIPLKIITRKLKPSQVVVKIGCLSGTVEKSPFPKFEFILATEAGGCRILFDALDAPTSKLVKGLLKAQDEEK